MSSGGAADDSGCARGDSWRGRARFPSTSGHSGRVPGEGVTRGAPAGDFDLRILRGEGFGGPGESFQGFSNGFEEF